MRWDHRSCKTKRWDRDEIRSTTDVQPRQHNATLMYYTDDIPARTSTLGDAITQGKTHTRHTCTPAPTHRHEIKVNTFTTGWHLWTTSNHISRYFGFFLNREEHIITSIFCIVCFFQELNHYTIIFLYFKDWITTCFQWVENHNNFFFCYFFDQVWET